MKKSSPSDDVAPISSEDDLLGPGDGNSKIVPKSILKPSNFIIDEYILFA